MKTMTVEENAAGLSRVMRCMTWVVSTFYLSSLFLPQLAQAHASSEATQRAAPPSEPASVQAITKPDELDPQARDFKALRLTLTSMQAKSRGKRSIEQEKKSLRELSEHLRKLDAEDLRRLDEVGTHLKSAGLPDVILKRHEDMAHSFVERANALQADVDTVEREKDPKAIQRSIAALQLKLDNMQTQRPHERFDPTNLPIGRQGQAARPAARTAMELQERLPLEPQKRLLFASLAGVGVAGDLGTSTSDYLSVTPDVQITQAIRDQAAQLHNNPVEIFNWVRNNIDFVPTYGSVQGSDLTLQALRGNAFDTSSLLIALLRAAGIPSRYVYGTVEIPAEQLMGWAGGFDNAQAAVDFLGQGGIPITALAEAGVIKSARLEHVWVEAWVGYHPGRGAKNTTPDSWIPMDASFKTYQEVPTLVTADMTSGIQGAVQNYMSSATVTDAGASSTGYDTTQFDAASSALATDLTNQVAANPDILQLDQVIGGRTIVAAQPPVLANSLPYRLVARGAAYASLPDNLRVSARLDLFTLADDLAGGTPVLSQQITLAAAGFASLNLTHVPASAADAAAWAAYQTPGTTEFPPYLIQVKAQLSLAGTVLADSAALPFGEDMVLHVTFGGAAAPRTATFSLLSGDEVEIGINGGGQATALGLAMQGRTDLGTAAGNLFVAAKTFWIQQDLFEATIARITRTAFARLPSVGTFSSPVSVVYRYGTPFSASYHSRATDIKLAQESVKARDGDPQKTRNFVTSSGMVLSSLESAALEEVFNKSLGRGSNTMRLLELANDAHIPIYHITSANWTSYQSSLQHPQDVINDINDAVNAGLEVIIPQTQQTNGAWTGSGYIILDPQTGTGDYRINGGLSGAAMDECKRATEPVKIEVPQISPIFAMLMEGMVDDNFDFNSGGFAAIVTFLVAAAVIAVVGGALATMAISALSSRAIAIGLGFVFGLAATALAADDCSCTPKFVSRRGGNAFHDACANQLIYTDVPNRDVKVDSKNFDGLKAAFKRLNEIKTGLFYGRIRAKVQKYPRLIWFVAALLTRAAEQFTEDRNTATACGFEYNYNHLDGDMVADLQRAFNKAGDTVDAQRVVQASCGP